MTDNIQSAAVTDRGLSEKRPQNEDSYLEMPSRGLFAVADGVGGAQAGDVASQMAMEILQEAFVNSTEGGDAEELMQIAIERANEAIYRMSHELSQLSTMATTVVALHLENNIATIGHVGDSRLYRVDSRGNIFRETQDHSVVEEEVRAGRMTATQAANHPSRNVISRALGAENTVQVDMKTIMFEPNTTFLLCSDGITRHIEDHELRQLLNSDTPPAQLCDEMKNICYGRGAEDNLTAVIIRVAETDARNLVDIEEATVATPRQSAVNNAVYANTAAGAADPSVENTLQDFSSLNEDNFQTRESIDVPEFPMPPSSHADEDFRDEDTVQTSTSTLTSSYAPEKEADVEVEKSGSFLGKLLGSLVLLLIGAGAGAAGYYFWQQSQTPPPQVVQKTPEISQMQTANIPYSAFEDNRRNVDRNPEQYIKTNGPTANDAEDYYLLGRANLLLGKYSEAWNNFVKAKELLPQMKDENKIMLANEIAIGSSIANVEAGRRYLNAERENINQSNPQNANVNTGPNTNTEIKPLTNTANP